MPSKSGGVAGGNPAPPPCASIQLSQSAWDWPNFFGVGCISGAPVTGDIGLARAFTMPADAGFAVHCVNVAIASSTTPFTVDANIWLGAPGASMDELTLLATRTVEIPVISFANGQLSIDFAAGGELPTIPAGATMIVEVFVPTQVLAEGGPGGATYIGANNGPATGPTYVRSEGCGIPDFVDLEPFIPAAQVVMRVDGEWVPGLVYGTGFEPSAFQLGAVNGQGGWFGSGEIQGALVSSGTQALRVQATVEPEQASRSLSISTAAKRVALEFDVNRVGDSYTQAGVSVWGDTGFIAQIAALDSVVQLGNTDSNTDPIPLTTDQWHHVSMTLDFLALTMSAAVDGVHLGSLPINTIPTPSMITSLSCYSFPSELSLDVNIDNLVVTCDSTIEAGPIVNPATCSTYWLLESSYWANAAATAAALGGTLVNIDDAAENEWVRSMFAPEFGGVWLNGIYSVSEAQWTQTDGTPLTYFNWCPGEPNGVRVGEHFLHMWMDGCWNDLADVVQDLNKGVVEIPAGPSSCPADLTADGIVDGADLGLLLAAWGACTCCLGELDHNGVVDGADLGFLLSSWGTCPN